MLKPTAILFDVEATLANCSLNVQTVNLPSVTQYDIHDLFSDRATLSLKISFISVYGSLF